MSKDLKQLLETLTELTHDELLIPLEVFPEPDEEVLKYQDKPLEGRKTDATALSERDFEQYVNKVSKLEKELRSLLSLIENTLDELEPDKLRDFVLENRFLLSEIPFARQMLKMIPEYLKNITDEKKKRRK